MQIALRTSVVAGIAAVGAGVIAMTPTSAPPVARCRTTARFT